ncbi:IMPACT family protein [Gordonia neofelifaecis]|uniref:Impact N-terminal domain-containing protein n=1 Tax=Gordonia neofelifaecis NRRL B-59395 TaxID=644548 RepID=F1YE09_9ACTN|nr:YigZ family protein [Gordonia neofelifaecis]EGD57099.1 hypothetical protein SCNU_01955 [Gordonia neofelifaecis NRRL B-59395]
MTLPYYLTLSRGDDAVGTLEVKRSKFLAVIRRVDAEDSAREFIAEQRRAYRDARHHCSAFVLGPRGQTTRTNDDGEPSGTAGAPMLDVLVGAGLSDVCAVVIRWFGGTLLGAGGLVRAYGDAVSLAVDAGTVVRREQRAVWRVRLSHMEAGRVEGELRAKGAEIVETEYGADVVLVVAVGGAVDVAAMVAASTSGAGAADAAGEMWVDIG